MPGASCPSSGYLIRRAESCSIVPATRIARDGSKEKEGSLMDDESDEVRTFTLSEASSLIPRLRKLLGRVSSQREALVDMRVEIDRARENADQGGGSPLGAAYLKHLMSFSEAVQEIESLGVLVKDFRNGLVDFPHEREGRIVYLCWKPDEEEISWWHEVDTGFAGRRSLTDDLDCGEGL